MPVKIVATVDEYFFKIASENFKCISISSINMIAKHIHPPVVGGMRGQNKTHTHKQREREEEIVIYIIFFISNKEFY